MTNTRLKISIPIKDINTIKRRMLQWAYQRNILLFFDSNNYTHTAGRYECLLAVDAHSQIAGDKATLSDLKTMYCSQNDWLFGHINYDFKNNLAHLSSAHSQHLAFPEIHFFCPQTVCYILRGSAQLIIETLSTQSPFAIWQEIDAQIIEEKVSSADDIRFQKQINKEEYLGIIKKLQQHIKDGDCYEINFCNEAFKHDATINPLATFTALNKRSPNPFAAFYKLNDQYLMCASPERYLYKSGNTILAQPIKGTAPKLAIPLEDEMQKTSLSHSIKDRAENVMIVDLMRNDLARFCKVDSVKVTELFGLYSFPQVHQLISSITGELAADKDLFDALRMSFPMGSMTGAPKYIVMQLIEQYEQARRGLFSGAVGYISPDGDFDFNVVIRSLFYNQKTKYLNYQTGGAITADSIPEQEWEETCVKALAMEQIFKNYE
ncbi:MAG: anthranilate synthase component I family protein [Chitinophagaceae bacterium]|nr:anthranilate synthase component I family protein [Chitinophagaceae bacterium]